MKQKRKTDKVQIIDATGKSLGRLSSQIALILEGKDKANFAPHKPGDTTVIVENLSKVKFTGKKYKNKLYRWHTGYLGHLKELTLEQMWKKSPERVLRLAVRGMLPKNKLRDRRLKRLKIKL